jgi:hypothetical protein
MRKHAHVVLEIARNSPIPPVDFVLAAIEEGMFVAASRAG